MHAASSVAAPHGRSCRTVRLRIGYSLAA
jgi:hypothetical protein